MIALWNWSQIYSDMRKSKELGSYEDFVEILKVYDKNLNGKMMLGELENILLTKGDLNIKYVRTFS